MSVCYVATPEHISMNLSIEIDWALEKYVYINTLTIVVITQLQGVKQAGNFSK